MEDIALDWCQGQLALDLPSVRVSQFAETIYTGTGIVSGTPLTGITLKIQGTVANQPKHAPGMSRSYPLNYVMVAGGQFQDKQFTGTVMSTNEMGSNWTISLASASVKQHLAELPKITLEEDRTSSYRGFVSALPEELLNENVNATIAGVNITKGLELNIDGVNIVLGWISDEFSYYSVTLTAKWKTVERELIYAAASFLRALSFRVGYNVDWIAILSDPFEPFLTLHNHELRPANRLPPIPYTADVARSNELLQALFRLIRNDRTHTLRVYPDLLFRSLTAQFETWETLLGPAIESLVTTITKTPAITGSQYYKDSKAAYESAKKEIVKWIAEIPGYADQSLFGRFSGILNSFKYDNVPTGLELIERFYGISVTEAESKAWQKTRNPASHGTVREMTENRMEHFFQLLNLYYKLALAYLDYKGDAIAYSSPYFQLASFACHRRGVCTVKHNLPHELIAQRAYDLWQKDGCKHGNDEQYWYVAECQLSKEREQSILSFASGGFGSLRSTS